MVPMVINSKILILHKKLNSLIDEIVSSCNNAGGTSSHHHHHRHDTFSSSDYFFVSTNIARRFMDVPESAIVLAYSDQHPTIKQINDSIVNDNNANKNSSNDDDDSDTSICHCVVVALGALVSLLLQALTIVLLGMGQLPDIAQV